MKKRILFVDDEPLVLAGLQRTLRKLRQHYDMEFAEGGEQALGLLGQRPFDVVVTDMRMPGMNGAELLQIVMGRHPRTIRFVLSGHADQDMIAQCHGVAHQFLSKPCDPDLLTDLILQAGNRAETFKGRDLHHLLHRIEKLPTLPSLYGELEKELASDGVSANGLGALIARDIGMTAKILQLVNSAFFGLSRVVTSPVEAVAYLGIDTVRSLVLAHGLFEAVELNTRRLTSADLWNHSLAVAGGARALSRVLDASGESQDSAFSGGLLHDVGILVLACNFPETYDNVIVRVEQGTQSLADAEQELLGVLHEDAGAYLMDLWGLPPTLVQGILYHHRPLEAEENPVVVAIHLADAWLGPRSRHPLWHDLKVDSALASRPRISKSWDALVARVEAGMPLP